MHRFVTLVVTVGAVGAFATSVLAATPDAADSQQVQIKGQRSGKVQQEEFAAMRGAYRLTDGRLLFVGGARLRPTAELGNMGPVVLQAMGPNRMASADGAMILRFNAKPNGDIDEVVVSLPATGVQISSSRF